MEETNNLISIKNIMILEKLLLVIDSKFKYEMDFPNAFKLYEFLKTIGRITNYAFAIQEGFHDKYKDAEKLREYHIRIINSKMNLNYKEIIEYIEYINAEFKNEEFNKMVNTIKFW